MTVFGLQEEYINKMCADIIRFRPDIVVTEKGLSGKLIGLLALLPAFTPSSCRSGSALPGQG